MRFRKLLAFSAAAAMAVSALPTAAFADNESSTRTVRLAIITDPHYVPAPSEENYDIYEKAGRSELRLMSGSEHIFDQTLKDALAASPDSILLCGDLTSDGEKAYAEELADKLAAAKDKIPGRILVTNGNHDVNNSYAAGFENGTISSGERMSAEEFRTIFGDFGFDKNSRYFGASPSEKIGNSGSLSYAAEICEGITLIVLDTNTYSDSKDAMFDDAQQTVCAT